MSPLKKYAEYVRQAGRFNDSVLAHISPKEAMLLKQLGGSGSINPKTGLPEFVTDEDISNYINHILSGSGSDAEKAATINAAAAQYGVSRNRIASATGYGLDVVNTYLGPVASPPPSPVYEPPPPVYEPPPPVYAPPPPVYEPPPPVYEPPPPVYEPPAPVNITASSDIAGDASSSPMGKSISEQQMRQVFPTRPPELTDERIKKIIEDNFKYHPDMSEQYRAQNFISEIRHPQGFLYGATVEDISKALGISSKEIIDFPKKSPDAEYFIDTVNNTVAPGGAGVDPNYWDNYLFWKNNIQNKSLGAEEKKTPSETTNQGLVKTATSAVTENNVSQAPAEISSTAVTSTLSADERAQNAIDANTIQPKVIKDAESGTEYNINTLVTLADQIAKNFDVNQIGGSAFGSDVQSQLANDPYSVNIGFNAGILKDALGSTPNAGQMVILDMARNLMRSGVTDLSQLKISPVEGSYLGIDENGNAIYGTSEQIVGPNGTPINLGNTYTGEQYGGGTAYGLDLSTGKPRFYTASIDSSSIDPFVATLLLTAATLPFGGVGGIGSALSGGALAATSAGAMALGSGALTLTSSLAQGRDLDDALVDAARGALGSFAGGSLSTAIPGDLGRLAGNAASQLIRTGPLS